MSHGLKAGDTVWTAWCTTTPSNDSETTVASAVIESVTSEGWLCTPKTREMSRRVCWLRKDLGAPTKAGALSMLAQSLRKRAEGFREDAQRLILDAEYEEARAAKVESLAAKAREEEASHHD